MKNISKSFILTAFVLWITHFIVDLFIGLWPIYKTWNHLDLAFAGLIGAVSSFAGDGLQALFGILSDKGHKKFLIVCGVLATAASTFLMFAHSYLGIFFLVLITGVGSGAFHPAAASLIAEVSNTRKALMMGIFTSGGALGLAVSQIAFTQTMIHFNSQLWVLSCVAVPILLMVMLLRAANAPKKETNQANFKIFAHFFKNRELRTLYFSLLCNATLVWGMMFLLPDLLSTRGVEPWITYGGGHFFYMIGLAIMMIPAGYLADRYSCRHIIIFSLLFSLIILYTILYLPLASDYTILLLLFCFGLSLGAIAPVGMALGTRLAPHQKGAMSAFTMGLVWCVSESLSQGMAGYLATCFSDDGPAKALAIMGVMLFAGIIIAYQLPEREEALASLETI